MNPKTTWAQEAGEVARLREENARLRERLAEVSAQNEQLLRERFFGPTEQLYPLRGWS